MNYIMNNRKQKNKNDKNSFNKKEIYFANNKKRLISQLNYKLKRNKKKLNRKNNNNNNNYKWKKIKKY